MSAYGAKQTYQGKWNEEEYAAKGRERQRLEYEKRQRQGREEIKTDAVEATARSERLDIYEGLNQVTLVPGRAATGKRGRGAGFYCQICDLTFKDSLDYTDHLNSKQHLYASGQKETVSRATLQDVRDRLEYLRQNRTQKKVEFDVRKRIEEMREREERKREERRERRRKHKEKVEGSQANDNDMMSTMGFSGFGSTKM
jgi:U4/U6.U5 tri-snRNP component SNU23